MAITYVPVDPARFSALIFMGCEPKLDRETGNQHTNKDGTARKWIVFASAMQPAGFDPSQSETGTLQVTVTAVDEPANGLAVGALVTFDDMRAGTMKAQRDESTGRLSGGNLFWQATGVRAKLTGKS
jgi:hypothetical protein